MSRYELCKFFPTPDPELVCGICMNVLDTPYETLCRHVFCYDCIWTALRKSSKCPICRAPCKRDKIKEVLPLVQNLINKLTMKCDNYDNGCTELIFKEFYLDHIKSCEFVMVQCRYTKCGQKMLKKDCEEHETKACIYRDHYCEGGCGLMVPQENIDSHNCKETLLILVKELKEKNLELQKKLDELKQTPGVAKRQSLIPTDENHVRLNSFFMQNDDSFSFTSSTLSSYQLSETEMTDLEDESYVTGQRSRRLATSESAPDVELSDNSYQSHTSQISRNNSDSDDDNAYRSSDDTVTSDGDNSVGTPEYQTDGDILNHGENNESHIDSRSDVSPESCSHISDNTNSLSVLDCSDNCVSEQKNTDHARPKKRKHEESRETSGDNNGMKKVKQSRQLSFECNDAHSTGLNSEGSSLWLAGSSENHASNAKQLSKVRKNTHGYKKNKIDSYSVADSQTPCNYGSSSSAVDEAGSTSDQTNGMKASHTNNAPEFSFSDDAKTMNVSTESRDECNLPTSRSGPLTRSRGQGQQNLLEVNIIQNVKVPPSMAYLLNKYAHEDDSSDDESWSPSHK